MMLSTILNIAALGITVISVLSFIMDLLTHSDVKGSTYLLELAIFLAVMASNLKEK